MVPTNSFVLTLDIDWAPDFMIDQVADILLKNNVKATWFVTHESDAVNRLKNQAQLFELGIHPNMLCGSTHGKTQDEVLTHIKEIVPNAVSMRTHGLYQTSPWLTKAAKEYGIQTDVSLFLPRATHLQPHKINWNGSSLWRLPYFWEDDAEMFEENPIWSLSDERLSVSGLRIFDFHPIHIVLNTDDFGKYEALKKIKPLSLWDKTFIDEHIYTGFGPRNIFLELVSSLKGKGTTVTELVNQWIES